MRAFADTLRRVLGRPATPACDPFVALTLQHRLSRLAAECAALDSGGDQRFARGFHLHAALAAYERTLLEACQLADVPIEPDPSAPAATRLLAETLLRERGWTW
jgi:hypothetical protein